MRNLAASSSKRRSLSGVGNTEVDRQQTLSDPQVFCAAFAAPGVNFDFVRNPLTFCQAGKSRAFNGADVNENIVSAIVGLNKPKTLLAIEPLNSTCRHFLLQSISRANITRFHSTGDVFGKEPAGAFRKAQRLIECGVSTGFRGKIQAARPGERGEVPGHTPHLHPLSQELNCRHWVS
jgi:hypothetical protein